MSDTEIYSANLQHVAYHCGVKIAGTDKTRGQIISECVKILWGESPSDFPPDMDAQETYLYNIIGK